MNRGMKESGSERTKKKESFCFFCGFKKKKRMETNAIPSHTTPGRGEKTSGKKGRNVRRKEKWQNWVIIFMDISLYFFFFFFFDFFLYIFFFFFFFFLFFWVFFLFLFFVCLFLVGEGIFLDQVSFSFHHPLKKVCFYRRMQLLR